MAQNSKIEWCDATFNPWMGCAKVSEACAHCYAEVSTPVRRQRAAGNELWGKGAKRVRTAEAYWKQPIRWNGQAIADCLECDYHHGFLKRDRGCMGVGCSCGGGLSFHRPRVFGGSLCDWLDDEVPIEWLVDYLKLIHATPHLDWLLLTKRPAKFQERILMAAMWMCGYRYGQTGVYPVAERSADLDVIESVLAWSKFESHPANVWIGTTVENQARANDRIPKMLEIPAAVRFLSVEPMLEAVDLTSATQKVADGFFGNWIQWYHRGLCHERENIDYPKIDWVICGGESGSKCRPFDPEWARDLRDQCQSAGVSFFMKQIGGKRKPFPEIPEDLMVRQFPKMEVAV